MYVLRHWINAEHVDIKPQSPQYPAEAISTTIRTKSPAIRFSALTYAAG